MAVWTRVFSSAAAAKGAGASVALFVLSVFAFFAFLPLRTDSSVPIVAMTVLGIWAAKCSGVLSLPPGKGARVPLWGFALFFCVAIVASVLNPPTLSKLPRVFLWGCCIFSGLMLSRCLPRHRSSYFWATFAVIAASFFAAIIFLGYDTPSIWHDERLKLFAIHPSRLALYCAVCFFFFLHRSIVSGGYARFASVVAMVFILFIAYKTNTRGNLLMLPIGVLCIAASLTRAQLKLLGMALIICAVVGGGVVVFSQSDAINNRLVSAITNTKSDPNFLSRLPIWEVAWESFKAAPVIGHGVHSYLDLHAKYTKTHKNEWDARYKGYYEQRVKQAHNIILGRLVETGLVGTLGFFVFYFGAVLSAWRAPQEYRWLVAPLVFYFAMSMFDDGLFRINDALILFIAGTALGLPPRAGYVKQLPWNTTGKTLHERIRDYNENPLH